MIVPIPGHSPPNIILVDGINHYLEKVFHLSKKSGLPPILQICGAQSEST